MNGRVLVLNASFEPINVCTERRAVVMIFKGVARMEEHNGHMLHSAKLSIHAPSVIRLTDTYTSLLSGARFRVRIFCCATIRPASIAASIIRPQN